MTDTVMLLPAEVVAYVSAVRAHLDDLAPDVVEELTGGLEADLADLAAESDAPLLSRIGSPDEYAGELRSSAGLPPRSLDDRPGRSQSARARSVYQSAKQTVCEHPQWPAVRDFALVIRPAWWLARGALLALELWAMTFGFATVAAGVLGSIMIVIGAVFSVQVGRGYGAGRRWVTQLVRVANGLAVLVALMSFSQWSTESDQSYYSDAVYSSVPTVGVYNAGSEVENIFAYDAQGKPLKNIQLFDEDGKPLATTPVAPGNFTIERTDSSLAETVSLRPVPARDAFGRELWNVFPHSLSSKVTEDEAAAAAAAAAGDAWDGDTTPEPIPLKTEEPVPPLVVVPPLAPTSAAKAASAPGKSPAASAKPKSQPSRTATPTPRR